MYMCVVCRSTAMHLFWCVCKMCRIYSASTQGPTRVSAAELPTSILKLHQIPNTYVWRQYFLLFFFLIKNVNTNEMYAHVYTLNNDIIRTENTHFPSLLSRARRFTASRHWWYVDVLYMYTTPRPKRTLKYTHTMYRYNFISFYNQNLRDVHLKTFKIHHTYG